MSFPVESYGFDPPAPLVAYWPLAQAHFEARFPALLAPLGESCLRVQSEVGEYLKLCFAQELSRRFDASELSHVSADGFIFRSIRYAQIVDVSRAHNSLLYSLLPSSNFASRRSSCTSISFRPSLTYSGISLEVADQIASWVPIAIEICKSVVGAINHWLGTKLFAADQRSAYEAAVRIHQLLREHFGAASSKILPYIFRPGKKGPTGAYLFDAAAIQSLRDKLAVHGPNHYSAAVQMASLVDAEMARELTESSQVLDKRDGFQLVTAIEDGRKYERDYQEFTAAENAIYGTGRPVVHPLIYRDEHPQVELVACYPNNVLTGVEGLPAKLNSLRPRIRDILRECNVLNPPVVRVQPRRETTEIFSPYQPPPLDLELSENRRMVIDSLTSAQFIRTFVECTPQHHIRISKICQWANNCRTIDTLRSIRLALQRGRGAETLNQIERMLILQSKAS